LDDAGNGWDGSTKPAQTEKTKHIPIFMLTSKEEKSDVEQAVSRGADNYIAKPFNTSQIDVIIRNKLKEIKKTTAGKKNILFPF
jgi:DNA-binding response OmpR family regulator